jgi:acyl carrier protein
MPKDRAITKDAVRRVLFEAIDEINDTLPDNRKLQKLPETQLFGRESGLDSLGLVNLIVAFEQRLGDELGLGLTLADEKALSRTSSPFRSVDALANYVLELVEHSDNG